MSQLLDEIQRLVAARRYLVSEHAIERLEERGVLEWQVVAGIASAKLLKERPRDQPNPCVEVEQILADGTPIKAVWSHVRQLGVAKLVTAHFFDE